MSGRNKLPPLNAVRVFQVAAKHLSFVKAADELGVTQSAVSKQIALLEDFIGAKLFEREPGGVSLTLEGRELHQSIGPALERLTESFQRYSRKTPGAKVFRLATLASFATQVLAPKLESFDERFSGIEIEILTSDRIIDLHKEEADLSVRYGAGKWEGLVATPLDDGALLPVCSPTLFGAVNGDIKTLVSSKPRIQVFLRNEWRNWQAQSGFALPKQSRVLVLEHFLVAMQAVLVGYGAALLPMMLVKRHIDTGEMVQFSDAVAWDQTFFAVHKENAENRPLTGDILEWLKSQV